MNGKPDQKPDIKTEKPKEIKLTITVLADPTIGSMDIRGFNIEPADIMSIEDIGRLLGQNVAVFLMRKTKPASNIKV